MNKVDKHLYPEEGKYLFRIIDNAGPFTEVILGYAKHNGVIRRESEKDYEERDKE